MHLRVGLPAVAPVLQLLALLLDEALDAEADENGHEESDDKEDSLDIV